jgi:outer membrane cobalamin receptor
MAGGEPQSVDTFWVSRLSAGQGVDDSESQSGFGTSAFKTRQRQYAWQNEFTVPAGTLIAGYERREERVATDAAFATTARDTNSLFAVYRPASSNMRCRRICGTTIRLSSATGPPALCSTAFA